MRQLIQNSGFFVLSFILMSIALNYYVDWAGIIYKSELTFFEDRGIDFTETNNQVHFNEGFSIHNYNSLGVRGKEISIEPVKDVYRIALIGDSYIEAKQVFDRHYFGTILEKSLSKKLHKKIEVINFGYSGSEFTDMFIYQQLKVNQFKPDLILYFISNSDFSQQVGDPLLPYLTLENDSLLIQNDFNESAIYKTAINSYLKRNLASAMILSNCTKTSKEQFWSKLLDKFYIPSKRTNKKENTANSNPTISLITKTIQALDFNKTILINRGKTPWDKKWKTRIKEANITTISLSLVFDSLRKNGQNPYYWNATKKLGHWNVATHKQIGLYLSNELSKTLKTSK